MASYRSILVVESYSSVQKKEKIKVNQGDILRLKKVASSNSLLAMHKQPDVL